MNWNKLATNRIEGPSFSSFKVELSVFDQLVIIIFFNAYGPLCLCSFKVC